MKRYKHKKTGDIVVKRNLYYIIEGYDKDSTFKIPERFIEESEDWEEIKEKYPFIPDEHIKYFEEHKEEMMNNGYAPGNYANKCRKCRREFTGDKYAYICFECAKSIIETPVEEVIEGYAYSDDGKSFDFHKTSEPDGIRAIENAILIINPTQDTIKQLENPVKREEYVRWVDNAGLSIIRKNEGINFGSFVRQNDLFSNKIKIIVESEKGESNEN